MAVTPKGFSPDPQQQEAIEHVHGPMLVVAGAGTGKTTVLTRRIARLVEAGHAQPHQILALTYTRASAEDMSRRAAIELQKKYEINARTFHDYCFDLLNRHGRGFEVLDDKDLWIFVRRRIRELDLKHFVRAADVGEFLTDMIEFMRRCQDELVTPERYAEYVRGLEVGECALPRVAKTKKAGELSDADIVERCQEVSRVYSRVEEWLSGRNLGTFGHMITKALALLESSPEALAEERQRARFTLIDEFQDSNFAQIRILRLLAGDERNLFAVGDPDQAIYRFRGASSGCFDMFVRAFPDTRIARLERNRRSLTPILQCAHAVINENPPIFSEHSTCILPNRRSPLVSARAESAAVAGKHLNCPPVEIAIGDAKLEAADIASTILKKRRELRCSWHSFAVLYRAHSHRDEVVRECSEHDIPVSIEGMDVLDTPEARDLLACIGAIVAPSDSGNVFRVAAMPRFKIDPAEVRAAMRADQRNTPLVEILKNVAGGQAVLECLFATRAEITKRSLEAVAATSLIVGRFALPANSLPVQAVLSFLREWEKKPLTETRELGEFVEWLKYFREAGGTITATLPADHDGVVLMTAHGAKGLEFDHVSVIRVSTETAFPKSYIEPLFEFPAALRDKDSVASGDSKEIHHQEERRLFYVAMTRARDSLTLYSKRGRGNKDPSPPGFLRELLHSPKLEAYRRKRDAVAVQEQMFAAADSAAGADSPLARWLNLPPLRSGDLRLSATALESYQKCPLRFKLERDWRIPGETPAAVQYGAAMHAALRHYYDAHRMGRPASEEDLVALFLAEFDKAVIEDAYQRQLYREQGIAQLRNFVNAAKGAAPPQVLHTEEYFEVDFGPAKLVGRIDRIDRTPEGGVTVVDYKTGKPKKQEDADDSVQLSIYCLAAQEKWGYKVERLVFHNLEGNVAVETRRDEFKLAELKETVEGVVQRIGEGDFSPTPGYQCRWCQYRNLCPAQEKSLNLAIPEKKRMN